METALKNVRMLLASLALAAAGCGESNPPTAPTSSDTAALQIAALKVTEPTPVSPSDGSRLDTRRPTLVVNNPTAPHAPTATLQLRFVVQDETGQRLHESGLVSLGAGTTSYVVPMDLELGRTFRWHAEAVWNNTSGPASVSRSFATTSPEPPPPPIDACTGGPFEIVACQRSKAPGHMSSSDFVRFLRAVAANLNQNGIPGGPFGLLHKTSGHHCEGYSCDILCAGQGGGQRQWDVVLDIDGAQTPTWNGPVGNIRVDACEIQ